MVMGVSGAGKSVVGRALADALRWPFLEGDALHPAGNVQKMARGEALTDADRAPWLAAVAGWIDAHRTTGGVVACSALRRRYRDVLRGEGRPMPVFVLLHVAPDVLRRRLGARRDHFMPVSLLDSQLATLELFDADERGRALIVEGRRDVATIMAEIGAWLTEQAGKEKGQRPI